MASSAPSTDPQVITFGCRLNSYESEVMRDHARSQGLQDAIIINTCAVTAEAERQARQSIRRLRRENLSALIIVTGCSVQTNTELYANMPEIDRILGNHEKMQREWFSPHLPDRVHVTDIMTIRETAHHLITGFENHVRAFIQIQNGCDHRCTFCKIPFGRGNNRSVPIGEIVAQIRALVEQGCREIVFTGVDITGYGPDLPGKPTLGQMTRRVLNLIPDLPRLRLSSIDPIEVEKDLMALIVHEPRLMPHLHLSLQSGDNMILKRMKRRHSREDAIDFCRRVINASLHISMFFLILLVREHLQPVCPRSRKYLSRNGLNSCERWVRKSFPSTCTIVPVNNAQSLSSVTPEDIRNTSHL